MARTTLSVTGCWIADVGLNAYGYSRVCGQYGHRVAYEHHRGPIPDDLPLDHLCRVRNCVNPWHLEPVTPRENHRRGISAEVTARRHAARSACPQGHPYPPDVRRNKRGRVCPTCEAAREERKRLARIPDDGVLR
jgi:hypothetical protein